IDREADYSSLETWLSQKAGRKVVFLTPKQGEQKQLLDLCFKNAAENLSERANRTGREMSVLNELASLLGLHNPPRRIESFDISHTAGSENVAGMVVYRDGRPYKPAYRKFRIKGFTGQDDYRSMAEVVERRLQEYEKGEDEEFSKLPDLILLDGGQGQTSAVQSVLEAHGISVPVFGMVKDSKHRTRAIAAKGGDIAIRSNRAVFTFVTGIQDEVHRFAIGYHRNRRKQEMLNSELTTIPGIGKTRAKALISSLKTIKAVREASVEELAAVPGMTRPAAERVYEVFHDQ
ncbi:MAG: excinuclease ABC subunit UvrC, partial [Clostridia bacterium]|nr:excinuclease ABC subunit UvrC [Clostridia bacterium]